MSNYIDIILNNVHWKMKSKHRKLVLLEKRGHLSLRDGENIDP